MAKRTESNRGQSEQMPGPVPAGDTVDRMPSPDRELGGGSVDSDHGEFGESRGPGDGWCGPDGSRYSDSELLH